MKIKSLYIFFLLLFFSCKPSGVNEQEIDFSKDNKIKDSVWVNDENMDKNFEKQVEKCKLMLLGIDTIKKNDELTINVSAFHFDTKDSICWVGIRENVYNVVPDSGIKLLKIFTWDIEKANFKNTKQEFKKKYLIVYYEYDTESGKTKFIVDPNKTGKYKETK